MPHGQGFIPFTVGDPTFGKGPRSAAAVEEPEKETMDVTAKIPTSAIFLSMTFSP